MLGAFRRYGAIHALRSTSRSLAVRSTPPKLQWFSPSVSAAPYASKSLYHSSPVRFSEPVSTPVQDAAPEADQQEVGPISTFQDLETNGLVDPTIIRTIRKKMGLETMTDVQSQTIPESLKGTDILAQAKTGTGKTLAFLLPVLQNLFSDPNVTKTVYDGYFQRGSRRKYDQRSRSAADIRAIVISPTRELAEQIAVEARRVSYGTGLVVQTAVGGTQKAAGLRQIQTEGCHVLIATPGRLKDILSDPSSGVEVPKLSTLVLDEADRLLDDGFAPELLEIQHLLPDPMKVDRQTLMFSATLPKAVMSMVRHTMKPDFKLIKTVRDNETPTHLSVPQRTVVVNGLENIEPTIFQLVQKCLSDGGRFKGIVYFNSTNESRLAFEIFDGLVNDPSKPGSGHPFGTMFIGDIHSRLTQSQRTRTSQAFRKCESGLLLSTDVTARGLDYPNVTHIIQVGVPRDRETYIHRLGRTARANKTGEGWILLHAGEVREFERRVGYGLPIEFDEESFPIAGLDMRRTTNSPPETLKILEQLAQATRNVDDRIRNDALRIRKTSLAGSFSNKREMNLAVQGLARFGWQVEEQQPRSRSRYGEPPSKGFSRSSPQFDTTFIERGNRKKRSFGRRPAGRFDADAADSEFQEQDDRPRRRRSQPGQVNYHDRRYNAGRTRY